MDDDSNNWTKVQSPKDGKRNHSSSSEQNSLRTPVNKNKKFFFSANRYEVLSQYDQETMLPTFDSTNANTKNPVGSLNFEPKIALLPPIFLRLLHVTFTDLCTKLIEIIGVDNFQCKALADRLKIMTTNPDSYRTLVRFLREEKAEFHTYQLKEDKPTRVVIRNLHSTTPTELIKSELEQSLFEVRQVSAVQHKVKKIHYLCYLWTLNQPANPMTSSNSHHFSTQKLRKRNLISLKLLVNALVAKYMDTLNQWAQTQIINV